MGLHLENLDQTTRSHMLAEFDADVGASNNLYISPRLSATGVAAYPGFLRDAITNGDDMSLTDALAGSGILKTHEQSHRNGKTYSKAVPSNAARTLAEGEFNRYYLRGLAVRADAEDAQVEIYRARQSARPRPESDAFIGNALDPVALLHDLRRSIGVDTALGLPPGPNSGMSCRLILSSPGVPEVEAAVVG